MWKIKHIFDGEYGCEERMPNDKIKVSVTLQDENGQQKTVSAEDDWLTIRHLTEGSIWPEEENKEW